MADVQWSRVLLGCLVACIFALAGCGGGQNDEVVYLHVFNAYPGASSISVYGPSGVVTRDLPFGQRTAEPVAVDRNLGDDFTILIDGAPQPFETAIPIWSMYPHETGTVMFKRRSGETQIDQPVLYRHVQSGFRTGEGVPPEQQQESCRLVLDNGLSGSSGNLAEMSYVPAFKVNPACVGYKEQIGTFVDPRGSEFIQTVANNPWFYPVGAGGAKVAYIKDGNACPPYSSGPNGEVVIPAGGLDFVWAGSNYTSWNFDDDGNLSVPPTTGDLMQCLGWDPELDANQQQDVITEENLAACLSLTYETQGVDTNMGEIPVFEFPVGLGQDIPPGRCGFDVRADSDFESIFTGRNLDGEPVVSRAEFAPNQYYFWVLFGRPVNPLVEKWGANQPENGGGFVDLPDYPGDPSSGSQ